MKEIITSNHAISMQELPPNVACAVSLADQSTFIEDSQGLRWNVAISSIDGSFAFRHGWNAFSLDHDLQLGNILVFNYMKGSHFTVKIYDNSGCELIFFETNEKKRKRDHRDSIFKGGWCYAVDKSSMSKDDLGLCGCSDAEINKRLYEVNGMGKAPITKQYASNCEAEYAEEMCDMINREYGDKQGENRAHILDLYDYEMPKKIKNSGSEGSNKMAVVNVTCCHNADSSLILRNEASSVKDPVVKEVATRVIPLDGSEFERTLKNNYCEVKVKREEPSDIHSSIETSGHLFATLAVIPEENEETISAISTRATKKCCTADGSGKS